MRRPRKTAGATVSERVLNCVRAALLACVVTAIFILLLALLLKWSAVPVDSLHLANTIIKAACACLAGVAAARRIERYACLYGGAAGLLYILIAYVVFSLIEGGFDVGLAMLSDLLLGVVCGLGAAAIRSLIASMRAQAE